MQQQDKEAELEYRKIKDGRNKTGTGRKELRFFDAMDAVLGHKPATEPPVVVESGVEPTTSTAGDNTEDDVDEETDLGGSKSDEQETRSRSETPVVDTEKAKAPAKGKKRNKSGDRMDRMETFVEKVMKMQNESEQHYLRLEEKMMEMEERRQKENREFQLKMMGILCSQQGVVRQSSDSSGQRPGPSFNYHPMYSFTSSEDYGDSVEY